MLNVDEGVAIQSTSKKLMDEIEQSEKFFVSGIVNYIDYEKHFQNDDNPICVFFYKRKSFDHERELRVAFTRIPGDNGEFINLADRDQHIDTDFIPFNINKNFSQKSEYIHVDLNKLITRILVPPNTENWFKEAIESLAEKYELNREVVKSDMDNGPIF